MTSRGPLFPAESLYHPFLNYIWCHCCLVTVDSIWRSACLENSRCSSGSRIIELCVGLFSCIIWDPLQRCVWHGWGRIKVCSWGVSKWIQEEQKQCSCRKWGCKLWLSPWKSAQKSVRKEVVCWEGDLVRRKQKKKKSLKPCRGQIFQVSMNFSGIVTFLFLCYDTYTKLQYIVEQSVLSLELEVSHNWISSAAGCVIVVCYSVKWQLICK